MNYAPNLLVEAQPRVANDYGLFSVLSPRPSTDVHWQQGIRWEALNCTPITGGTIVDPNCVTPITKQLARQIAIGSAQPFTVYAPYKCGTFGHSLEEAQEIATADLLVREEAAAEQALMANQLRPVAVDITPVGGAVSIAQGVSMLEDWLANNYGSKGVIHATRGGAMLFNDDYTYRTANGLFTSVGTPIVAGTGYQGLSPSGGVPVVGETWVYASPAVFGYKSEVFTSSERAGDLLDRNMNDLYAIAERTYVVGFDPCGVAAIRITKTCC